MTPRLRTSLILAVLFLLPVPAASSAATFCVNKSGCAGSDQPTLQSALQAAETNPGLDRIEVGPGTYTAPSANGFVNDTGSDVVLIGSGVGVTTLTGPGGNNSLVLAVNESDSTVTNLTVRVPAGTDNEGLDLSGVASAISVTAPATAVDATGATVTAQGSLIRSRVELPYSPASSNRPVAVEGHGELADVFLSAATAIETGDALTGSQLRARRVTAVANVGARAGGGADARIDDAWFRVGQGPNGDDPKGLMVVGGAATLQANHVTVVGDGSAASHGITSIGAPFLAAAGNQMTADNTIVRNFALHVRRVGDDDCDGTDDCPANVTIRYSDYDFARTSSTGAGSISGEAANNNVDDVDPRFLSSTSPQLRFDSPLIDIGSPSALAAGESTQDVMGRARIRDGKAPFSGARRDMGAAEYQRLAPRVSASADPSAARRGELVSFRATASDPDGDALGFSWSFDDGVDLIGRIVEKRFVTGGGHSGTVTARDPTGLTTTATAELGDASAPDVDLESLSAKGNVVRVKLECDEDEGEDCEGSIGVRTAGKVNLSAVKNRVKLGNRKFDLNPGQTRKIKIKLKKKTLNRARSEKKAKRLKLLVRIVAKDDAGNDTEITRKPKLKLPRRKR